MSERFPHNFEQDHKPNKIENSTEQLEAYKYSIENRTKKNEQIEDARSNIEKLAISKEKTVAKPEKYKSQETTPPHQYITKN